MDISLPSQWIIEAEPWHWFAIGAPGFFAAWWLYGRGGKGIERKSTGGGLTVAARLLLGLVRWSAFTLLAFLLLEPLIRSIELDKEEPVAVVLIDQSASILARTDGSDEEQDLNRWFQALGSELEAKGLRTEWHGFDQGLNENILESNTPLRWDGAQTNLSAAISELNDRIENRNIAGVVLASDGLINRGVDAEYGTSWPLAPIYTLGLGDTTRHEDRWIVRVNHNQIAYLNNTFPVEAVIQSQGMEGQQGRIRIFQGSKQLAESEWMCQNNSNIKRVEFMLPASVLGTQRFRLEASLGDNEFDSSNNQRNFYVEILESRRVITCIADAPHPDLGAIALALDALDAYSVNTLYLNNGTDANDVLQALNESDVIIAHNLLGQTWQGKPWEEWLSSSEISAWWLATSQSAFNHLRNPNQLGVRMSRSSELSQNFRGRINPSYGIIDYDGEQLENALQSWPPMTGPMESMTWSQAWEPLLFKQLGSLNTQDAFWATQINASGVRTALTVGEGIWNWRMRNYLQNNEHGTFNQLIQRHVQFLAANDQRERFKIQTEPRLSSDLRINFKAEAYDAGWTMSKNATIEVILVNESGGEFIKRMRFDGERYDVDFGRMPGGQYTWNATCAIDRENFTDSGIIVIEDQQIEQSSLPADHGLLTRIAEKNGGSFLGTWRTTSPEQASAQFAQAGIPATVLHEQISLQNGMEWIPILLMALLLLALEWVIRRRTIGY